MVGYVDHILFLNFFDIIIRTFIIAFIFSVADNDYRDALYEQPDVHPDRWYYKDSRNSYSCSFN